MTHFLESSKEILVSMNMFSRDSQRIPHIDFGKPPKPYFRWTPAGARAASHHDKAWRWAAAVSFVFGFVRKAWASRLGYWGLEYCASVVLFIRKVDKGWGMS
jgi:hypothetical protein